MAFRPVDVSWLERLNARKLARPEVDKICRLCGAPIRIREGFDALCASCDNQFSPAAKVFQYLASVDRRPAVFEAGEVPTRYRGAFEDLAIWPIDPARPVDLRAWPAAIDEKGSVASGEPWALTIRGDFEAGKTRLAVELAARIAIRTRLSMLFVPAVGVSDAIHDEDPRTYARLCKAPILVVDDLGRSYSGNQGQAVQRLICDRYNWLRATIFTTNAEEAAFDDPSVVIRLGEGLQVEMTLENRGTAR